MHMAQPDSSKPCKAVPRLPLPTQAFLASFLPLSWPTSQSPCPLLCLFPSWLTLPCVLTIRGSRVATCSHPKYHGRAEGNPYLDLPPKQLVLGAWCLLSGDEARPQGSLPAAWDPEGTRKQRTGQNRTLAGRPKAKPWQQPVSCGERGGMAGQGWRQLLVLSLPLYIYKQL